MNPKSTRERTAMGCSSLLGMLFAPFVLAQPALPTLEQQKRVDAEEQLRVSTCKMADEAFGNVEKATAQGLQQRLGELAQLAQVLRAECDRSLPRVKMARDALNAARDRLLGAAHLPAPVVASGASGRPSREEIAKLRERAAEMQDRVDAQRAKAADPFGPLDEASKLLIGGKVPAADEARKARAAMEDAYARAGKVKGDLVKAQIEANTLIQAVHKLDQCPAADCPEWDNSWQVAQQAARTADNLLDVVAGHLKVVKDTVDIANGAKYTSNAERRRALAFQSLLDTYPSARSLVGEKEVFSLTAGANNGRASLKINANRLVPWNWRATSLILSAPTSKDGDATKLFTTPNGLAAGTSLTLSSYWLDARDVNVERPVFNVLQAYGFSLSGGRRSVTYLNSDPAKLGEKIGTSQGTWAASAYTALFSTSSPENSNVHILRFTVDRDLDVELAKTVCPLPGGSATTLGCHTGVFKAPERAYGRTLSYEYRLQVAKLALSPTFDFTRESGQWVKSFRLPVYFLRDGTKDNGLTAGLAYEWNQKDKGSVSLVVGAPFNLFSLDR